MDKIDSFEERKQKFQEKINSTSEAVKNNIQASYPKDLTKIIKVADIPNLHNKESDYEFDPNASSKEINDRQLLEFAEFIKGTPYEQFIAFKDQKVQELVDLIMATIVFEYDRLNGDDLPIDIHNRYKAFESFKDKIYRYSEREDKKGVEVTDYLGFRVLPKEDTSILFSEGDSILQRKIDKTERIRKYVVSEYKDLSQNPNMSFIKYCEKCKSVLSRLKTVFPKKATDRIQYYDDLIKKVDENLETYCGMYENSEDIKNNEIRHYKDISNLLSINILDHLKELEKLYPGEVILYKLNKNLLNVFENSELLNFLRYLFCST